MPSNYDHFLLDNALQYRNGVSLGNVFQWWGCAGFVVVVYIGY